jgi:hypothetical protein
MPPHSSYLHLGDDVYVSPYNLIGKIVMKSGLNETEALEYSTYLLSLAGSRPMPIRLVKKSSEEEQFSIIELRLCEVRFNLVNDLPIPSQFSEELKSRIYAKAEDILRPALQRRKAKNERRKAYNQRYYQERNYHET